MKISAIKLVQERDGLLPFNIPLLGDLVLVTGSNGAGKTRLLKMLREYTESMSSGASIDELVIEITEDGKSEKLTKENANQVKIINYSHYDAKLQSPKNFSPYVIHKAKEILKTCDYEETALNSLLFIEDMAKGYSEEFKDKSKFKEFQEDVLKSFNIEIDYNEKEKQLNIFGLDVDKAKLSPGQQYLLRMAVACFRNENEPGLIFFLDEPELHLHPKALIEMIERLRKKFPKSQFWISTHSISLISFYIIKQSNVTTLYLHDKKIDILRSNSSGLLDGLIGDQVNQFAVQQLFALTDEYACNKFTFECFEEPETLAGKDGNDIEVGIVKTMFSSNDLVVDFGAGKGRFLEELGLSEAVSKNGEKCRIKYFAYDLDSKDASICKQIMNKYGSSEDNYYNDIKLMKEKVAGEAKYVLLVNVLHEIPPSAWVSVFQDIKDLLAENGKLIIVERDELMIGEAPYEQGFLMLTSNGAKKMFSEKNVEEVRHPLKSYIVKYIISKEGLNIEAQKVNECIRVIQEDSLKNIQKIKSSSKEPDRFKRFKKGMQLVFWLHQYANTSLLLKDEVEVESN